MQILRPTESKTLGKRPGIWILTHPAGGSGACRNLRAPGTDSDRATRRSGGLPLPPLTGAVSSGELCAPRSLAAPPGSTVSTPVSEMRLALHQCWLLFGGAVPSPASHPFICLLSVSVKYYYTGFAHGRIIPQAIVKVEKVNVLFTTQLYAH